MAPPLVRHFMRRHFLNEIVEAECLTPHHHPALRGVEERANRQIDQGWPGLAEVELRLLRDGNPAVWEFAEVLIEQPDGVLRIDDGVFGQPRGREVSDAFYTAQVAWQFGGRI